MAKKVMTDQAEQLSVKILADAVRDLRHLVTDAQERRIQDLEAKVAQLESDRAADRQKS